MRRFWRGVAWVIGILIILALLGVLFVYSGLFNVAATYPDISPVAWGLGTTMDRSVQRHAAHITVPDLTDPAMIARGAAHYRDDCAQCHGAPGQQPGELAAGLNPPPPPLTDAAEEWKPNELFWITKYGVRMTGMPAWAPTHTDAEIWHITAFLEQLPKMTPQEYQKLYNSAPTGE